MKMRVPIESITFRYKEGTQEKFPIIVNTMDEANALLKVWARDAPKGGAYDKVGYTVIWANGDSYRGRFDLHHISEEQETSSGRIDLGESIKDHLKFVAKRVKGEALHRRELLKELYSEERTVSSGKMLDTLQFDHEPGDPPAMDDYWWSGDKQDLVVSGYSLPMNPDTGKPEWGMMELGDAHPKELHRLFFQCMHEGLGTYKGKHKLFSVEACKMIASACYSKHVCKKGMGIYREAFHREKLLTKERLPTGLKRR